MSKVLNHEFFNSSFLIFNSIRKGTSTPNCCKRRARSWYRQNLQEVARCFRRPGWLRPVAVPGQCRKLRLIRLFARFVGLK